MAPKMIVLLRHAEKPGPSDGPDTPEDRHLTADGRQRAEMLKTRIPQLCGQLPDFVFAAASSAASDRPVEMMQPLATLLPSDRFITSFANGQKRELMRKERERSMLATKALLLAGLIVLAGGLVSYADSQEHDSCTCKNVQAGAQSTLKGGLCTRTETDHCLMEWDGGSTTKTNVGNGMSQAEAATRTAEIMEKALGGRYRLGGDGVPGGIRSDSERAARLLFSNPPEKYGSPEIDQSFILAAGTALSRFDQIGTDDFIGNLAQDSERIGSLARSGGSFEMQGFSVRGRSGCLVISKSNLRVFVKTPFAADEEC